MDFERIVRGGTVVTGGRVARLDLGIRQGRIVALAESLAGAPAAAVTDATGLLVLPGAIDAHVHFALPVAGTHSIDDFASGTRAAACGGVTTVIDFATPVPGETMAQAIVARRALADPQVGIDYGLHAGIIGWHAGSGDELQEALAAGCPSFKLFMVYAARGLRSDDGAFYCALRETVASGATVTVHAENEELIERLTAEAVARGELGCPSHGRTRPAVNEVEAVSRAIRWAEATGGRLYVVHLAAGGAVELIRQARQRGVLVEAETCPQYLLLTDELFARPDGHHFATCPPIRDRATQEQLWAGLADGTLQVVATDTCPFTSEQKSSWNGDFRKIPFGLPGVETLLPLLHSEGVVAGRISLPRLVQLVAENPARIFGLWPRKGAIAIGADADLVVFDPQRSVVLDPAVLQSRCDYTPYQGRTVRGWVRDTLLRGEPVVVDGRFVGQPGGGRFLCREPTAGRGRLSVG